MPAAQIRFLLIDDDIDDQEIFSLALRQVDPSVKCVFADNGIHALEMLRGRNSYNPEIIFIDMNMPRMNGLECLQEIIKIKRLSRIPVYMYSTAGDIAIMEKCKIHGATDFMIKSASIMELEQALSRILTPYKTAQISREWKKSQP